MFYAVYLMILSLIGKKSMDMETPYWINMEYTTHLSQGGFATVKNITINGYPRTRDCEHYMVDFDGRRLVFDDVNDLFVFSRFLHDDIKRARMVSCKITNNIGFSTQRFGYSEGLDEFKRALDLLVSVSRLNVQQPISKPIHTHVVPYDET